MKEKVIMILRKKHWKKHKILRVSKNVWLKNVIRKGIHQMIRIKRIFIRIYSKIKARKKGGSPNKMRNVKGIQGKKPEKIRTKETLKQTWTKKMRMNLL
jgi:hypothetical protein